MRTRDQYIQGMARGVCFLAGIEAVDSADGSANWLMFAADVTPLVDSLIARGVFPIEKAEEAPMK